MAFRSAAVRRFNAAPVAAVTTPLLTQTRNAWVLKRAFPLRQPQEGERHKNLRVPEMKTYEVVACTEASHKPPLTVVLKEFVEGVGYAGDVVNVPAMKGRLQLLLPKIADYATPEALEWARQLKEKQDVKKYSSLYSSRIIRLLRETLFSLDMSSTNTWVLEPWHIRASLRAGGIIVPEKAIILPDEPIEGPDGALNKDVVVRIMVNGQDEALCRFRIRSAEDALAPTALLDVADIPWFLEEPVAYLESQQTEIDELHKATLRAHEKEMERLREIGHGI